MDECGHEEPDIPHRFVLGPGAYHVVVSGSTITEVVKAFTIASDKETQVSVRVERKDGRRNARRRRRCGCTHGGHRAQRRSPLGRRAMRETRLDLGWGVPGLDLGDHDASRSVAT